MSPFQMIQALERMQVCLELRALRPNTVQSYTRHARQFLEAVEKPPCRVKRGDIEQYLLGLRERGLSVSTRNVTLASIRFLLRATVRHDVTIGIPHAKRRRTLVAVLSGSEVARLIAATESPKYRAIFMVAYGAGLRVGEVRHLHVADIESKRGLIRVRYGKTGERYAPLGKRALEALRAYYRACRPAGPELFPGHRGGRSGTVLSRNAISKVLACVVKKAGIDKRVTPHTLRCVLRTELRNAPA